MGTVGDSGLSSTRAHVVGLTVLLLVTAGALGTGVAWHRPAALPVPEIVWLPVPGIVWLAVVLLSAAGERLAVHLESSDSAHSVTITELALVLGLVTLAPGPFVAAQVAGSGLVLALQQRHQPLKLAFNVCKTTLEAVVLLLVFCAVRGAADVASPRGWLAAGTAVVASNVVAAVAVTAVIWVHDREPDWSVLTEAATAGLGAAVANTGLALVAVVMLEHEPLALVFVAVAYVVLFRSYNAQARLSHSHRRVGILYDFTRTVDGAADAADVVDRVLVETRRLLRAETAALVLRRDGLVTMAVLDRDADTAVARRVDEPGRSWWAAALTGSSVLVPRGTGEVDGVAVPLRAGDAVSGVLLAASRAGAVSTFTAQDVGLLSALAGHAAIAVENSRLVSELRKRLREREHAAQHDALTGLPNRSALRAAIASELERRASFAVLAVDLDRFAEVNEGLGHACGDDLLAEVGRRLEQLGPFPHLAARLGSDEFAVLLPGSSEDTAMLVARLIRDEIARPVASGGADLEVTATVGIALPDDGATPDDLLRHADIALHRAKGTRDARAVYTSEDGERSRRTLALAAALRPAIAARQLQVWYQPQVAVASGYVVGAEALIRWRLPALGWVAADEIVATAERTGAIGALTDLVLGEATAQLRHWRDLGLDVEMSVNLSTRDLVDVGLPDRVAGHLERNALAPSDLTLEITESALMVELDRSLAVVASLAHLGVRLSVDDFGTGYSSLAYLTRLPVGELKIDRSFMMGGRHGRRDDAVVASTVALAHELGLRVVAEGVEDAIAEQRARRLGCDLLQGYHFSRPAPAEQVTALLLRDPVPSS